MENPLQSFSFLCFFINTRIIVLYWWNNGWPTFDG